MGVEVVRAVNIKDAAFCDVTPSGRTATKLQG
jgi:hypothetical protein